MNVLITTNIQIFGNVFISTGHTVYIYTVEIFFSEAFFRAELNVHLDIVIVKILNLQGDLTGISVKA